MEWFVILGLAFAVLSVGVVGVAALALRTAAKGLAEAGREASERIRPLAEELREEQAVTQLELESLQRRRAQSAGASPRRGVRYP